MSTPRHTRSFKRRPRETTSPWIRRWAKDKFNAEPAQVYMPWLPREEYLWLKGYTKRTGIRRKEAILEGIRLLREAEDVPSPGIRPPDIDGHTPAKKKRIRSTSAHSHATKRRRREPR